MPAVTDSLYYCFPRYKRTPQRKVTLRSSSPTMSMPFTHSRPFPKWLPLWRALVLWETVIRDMVTVSESACNRITLKIMAFVFAFATNIKFFHLKKIKNQSWYVSATVPASLPNESLGKIRPCEEGLIYNLQQGAQPRELQLIWAN